MLNFLDELYEVSNSNIKEDSKNYKLATLGNNVIYVANYIKVLSFSDTQVVLKVKDDTITIVGVKLIIISLDGGEIIIKGKVAKILLSAEAEIEK